MLAWIHTINETIIRNYALEHSIWWIHIWSIFQLFGWHLSTRTAQQNASHWSNWPKVSELCNFHSVRLIVLISVNAHFCIEFGCHPPPQSVNSDWKSGLILDKNRYKWLFFWKKEYRNYNFNNCGWDWTSDHSFLALGHNKT